MPLKQEVLPHLANMDPLTARIGACNTLRTGADGKLYGFNTDVAGVVRPLEKRLRLQGRAHCWCWARAARRAPRSSAWWSRARKSSSSTAPMKPRSPWRARRKAKSLKQEPLAKQHFDVIINTTPCGMTGFKQALPIKENELNAGLVFDMVYNPLETPLLQAGEVARPGGHQRPGDVCAAGRAPV